MYTLALIGFLGGLITGISPCILPVLPVIFLSGADNRTERLKPYRVIGGLVLSFSIVTLAGSAVLSLLHLPQGTLRWIGIVALVLIGLTLIFPNVEELLEKPFARIPQWNLSEGRSGFGLGLALGLLFVPCAGPVLAAIILAGATGTVGAPTVLLTGSFAIGVAIPLLAFALAGQRISERVSAFRRRQRQIRVTGGVVMLAFAVAITVNLPATLQRVVPDYTSALQDTIAGTDDLSAQLNLSGPVNAQNAGLATCTEGASVIENCGAAPDIVGITDWLNSAPVDLKSLHGKVVLIDFWAYSCINCQRAIAHVTDWYSKYKDSGFEVIGVHSPEYAFEKVPANVASGAKDLGITYPVALDNNLATWTNYRNQYWPAHYLIDADGNVRHIKFGEGDYDVTENLIRRLLTAAHPGDDLPPPSDAADTTPHGDQTPETYLSVDRAVNYGGTTAYGPGDATFAYPPHLADDSFALQGPWTLDYQGATSRADTAGIELNYTARNVYLVAGGQGTLTVVQNGETRRIPISGPPTLHEIATGEHAAPTSLEVRLSAGLQAYSFTFG